MHCPKIPWLLSILVIGLLTLAPAWRPAPTGVDLALVLAVDVSTSMDPDEQDLQRQGYVEAFRSPTVHQAIRTGMLGRIAVTYVEWGGARRLRYQSVVVPWTVLETPKDSTALADRLARAPIHRVAGTSISEAIEFSLALLASSHLLAVRQVIDISGDGSNNQGGLVTEARDKAVARGVTINGLPIMLKEPDRGEDATMDAYYRDCVIGGSNAFMIPVRERKQFLTETRAKIVREIAGVSKPGSPAQTVGWRPLTECDTSESIWDDFAPEFHAPVTGPRQKL
jgi:hypothetical protein